MLGPEPGVVVLDPAPVLVVGSARVVVDQRVLERRHVAECRLAPLPRRRPEELPEVLQVLPHVGHLARVVAHVLCVLRVDEERPEHVPLHRAALAALVLEAVRRHHVGPDRGQVRRALERGPYLRDRAVGAADGADPAVRPRLGCDPLADVVAVAPGVRRGGVVVDARRLGAVAVAQVDQHDVVALRDEVIGDLGVPLVGLVVRRVEHDRREAPLDEVPVTCGPVDVEGELHAVPHRHHHVLRHDDPVGSSAHSLGLPLDDQVPDIVHPHAEPGMDDGGRVELLHDRRSGERRTARRARSGRRSGSRRSPRLGEVDRAALLRLGGAAPGSSRWAGGFAIRPVLVSRRLTTSTVSPGALKP